MRTKDIIFNTLKNSKTLIATLVIYMILSTVFLIVSGYHRKLSEYCLPEYQNH